MSFCRIPLENQNWKQLFGYQAMKKKIHTMLAKKKLINKTARPTVLFKVGKAINIFSSKQYIQQDLNNGTIN